MMETHLILALVIVHVIADFALQSTAWIDERYDRKYASPKLYAHTLIHTIMTVAALIISQISLGPAVLAALVIGVSHFAIDLAKAYTDRSRLRWFVADQALHLLVLVCVWLSLTSQWHILSAAGAILTTEKVMLIGGAYAVVIWPFAIIIGMVCSRWTQDLGEDNSLTAKIRKDSSFAELLKSVKS